VREANGSTANTIVIFSGLAEEPYALTYLDNFQTASATACGVSIGIGFNTTTTFAGMRGSYSSGVSTQLNISSSLTGSYPAAPSLGINNVNALESAVAPGGATMLGTTASMLLQAQWRG